MTAVQQIIPLNILKCYLSIRRSKTEKITAFFYEILSPAGVCTSGIGYAGTGEDDETAVSVESEIRDFAAHTETLSGRRKETGKKLPATLLASLEGILGEVLTPEAVRESLDKGEGGNRTLEERIREEMAARLGYRATAYIKTERKSSSELEDMLGPDFLAGGTAAAEQDESGGAISFLIPCTPSIDPVRGVPAGALEKGDYIVVTLPSGESPLRERLRAADPGFDGTVRAEVLSVHRDRQGNFTILTRLSDEFSGVVTLEGNARLRKAGRDVPSGSETPVSAGPNGERDEENGPPLTPPVVLLLAGSGAILLTLLLMFRVFR